MPRLLAALLGIVFAGGALAAAPRLALAGGETASREAREHFERGEKLFALGRFAQALTEYEAAFEARALPEFLFNIGQCHRNLGNYRSAIFSFRKYLKLKPEAGNREAVETLIAELETELARADGELVEDPAPGPGHRPVYKKWWFWTGVAAVAAAGTGFLLLDADDGIPGSDFGNVDFRR